MRNFIRESRKFFAALAGAAATAVASGLLPESISRWAMVLIAVATALGVYAVPNEPRMPPPPF